MSEKSNSTPVGKGPESEPKPWGGEPKEPASIKELDEYLGILNTKYSDERDNDVTRPQFRNMIISGAAAFGVVFAVVYFALPSDQTFSIPFKSITNTDEGSSTLFAEKFELSFIMGSSGAAAAAIFFAVSTTSAVQRQNDRLSAIANMIDRTRVRIARVETDRAVLQRRIRFKDYRSHDLFYLELNKLIEDQEYELATRLLDSALGSMPRDPNLLKLKGTILGKSGDFESALRVFDAALDINPLDAQLWYDRALASAALGDTDNAISSLNRSLNINPNDVYARELLQDLMQVRVSVSNVDIFKDRFKS